MKILYFFLFLWVIFVLLDSDPDPATKINADPDTDPKPCAGEWVKNRNWLKERLGDVMIPGYLPVRIRTGG